MASGRGGAARDQVQNQTQNLVTKTKTGNTIDKIHEDEKKFHDQWAADESLEGIDVRSAFEASTAPENRFILEMMGDIRGKQILDIGSGLGESAVYFALRGAQVTAVDLSPGMIEKAKALAQKYGVHIHGVVCSAESLSVPDGSFDFVYAGNLLHHVTDRPRLYDQIHRALKPGGKFFSWDPLVYNPVIWVYRMIATRVRTDDEFPLRMSDFRQLRARFGEAGHREFWLTTLVLFLKFYLIDGVHPNQERYWKRILKLDEDKLGWFRALQRLDSWLCRIPGVRLLAWNGVFWAVRR